MDGFRKIDEQDRWGQEEPRIQDAGPGGVVVLRSIGNPETQDGRRIGKSFGELEAIRLRLLDMPDLAMVRARLLAEFPHAAAVTATLLGDLAGRPHVRLRPTLLIGRPGCGKTSFCARLLALLGVPNRVYPCGGASDPGLAGNPRRWITGEPSLPVTLIKEFQVASPGIVLDELEKVATSRQNGSLHDALMGMLEPRSAQRWMDPYLEAEVDISNVIWLGTVNTLEGIPSPLRDRCRIVQFPDPGPEHMPVLAAALLRHAVAERGWDTAWALPLDGVELEALARHWPGGSLRKLARLMDGILAARELGQGLQ